MITVAKFRMDKNKDLHEKLKEEEKNKIKSKANDYEKKVSKLDPEIKVGNSENEPKEEKKIKKKEKQKQEEKEVSFPIVETEKEELQKPVLKYEYNEEIYSQNEDIKNERLNFEERMGIEEILRKKIEQQQQLKEKNKIKTTPFSKDYTPKDMQQGIDQALGVDARSVLNISGGKIGLKIFFSIFFLMALAGVAAWLIVWLVF